MNEDFFDCAETITNYILTWYTEGYSGMEIANGIIELLKDDFDYITGGIDEQVIKDCSLDISEGSLAWIEINTKKYRSFGKSEEKIYHLTKINILSIVKNILEVYDIGVE